MKTVSLDMLLRRLEDVLFWALLVLAVVPILWMVLLSFMPLKAFFGGLTVALTTMPTVENYWTAFFETDFLRWFANSLIVSVTTTVTCLFISIYSGFYLARISSIFTNLVVLMLLIAQVFPENLLVIPVFIIFQKFGLANPYLQLILAHLSFTLPLAIWLTANYIRQVPKELEEAAIIDGANWLQIIHLVVLPVIVPGLAAAGIFTFLVSWGDFIWGLLFGNESRYFLLSVGLQQYSADVAAIQWGTLLAIAVLYTLPVIILFGLAQTRLVGGLSAGSLKG